MAGQHQPTQVKPWLGFCLHEPRSSPANLSTQTVLLVLAHPRPCLPQHLHQPPSWLPCQHTTAQLKKSPLPNYFWLPHPNVIPGYAKKSASPASQVADRKIPTCPLPKGQTANHGLSKRRVGGVCKISTDWCQEEPRQQPRHTPLSSKQPIACLHFPASALLALNFVAKCTSTWDNGSKRILFYSVGSSTRIARAEQS